MDAFRNQRTPYVAKTPKTPVPKGPRAPRTTRIKPPSIDEQANTQALGMFRTALARLQAATPAVDQAAIYAPYRASEQVAGQLGQGLQSSLATAGQNAQDQYTRGLGQAQQQAAQFGISAGAGANPTALQNTGTAAIASQSQAQQAAAPQAAAQWQQLLERTAAAKVSAADLARQQGLTSAQQSLSANLPSLIGQQQDRLFQRQTQRENMALAKTQLTAKQIADLRNYNLDVTKVNNATTTATTRSDLETRRLRETERHNLATEKGARIRAQKAASAGVKGIPQVLDTLKIASASKSGTKLTPAGFTATVAVLDPNTGEPTGDTKEIPLPDIRPGHRNLPTGSGGTPIYKFISAKTNYERVPAAAGKQAGMTLKQWNKALGVLLAYNPTLSQTEASAQLQRITPRPPK